MLRTFRIICAVTVIAVAALLCGEVAVGGLLSVPYTGTKLFPIGRLTLRW